MRPLSPPVPAAGPLAATSLQPVPPISSGWLYLGLALLCLLLALFLLLLPALLGRRAAHQPSASRHSVKRPPEQWRDKVSQALDDYQNGLVDESETYSRLASIARTFASERLGTDLRAKTLLDLVRHRQITDKAHFDSLKQTISALYPAEFAEPGSNQQARDSSVQMAADWVDSLIERWVA